MKKAMRKKAKGFLKECKKERKELLKKEVWSGFDFITIYYSYAKKERGHFYIPIKKIEKLASDKRTPDSEKLELFKTLAKHKLSKPNG